MKQAKTTEDHVTSETIHIKWLIPSYGLTSCVSVKELSMKHYFFFFFYYYMCFSPPWVSVKESGQASLWSEALLSAPGDSKGQHLTLWTLSSTDLLSGLKVSAGFHHVWQEVNQHLMTGLWLQTAGYQSILWKTMQGLESNWPCILREMLFMK